MNRAITRSAARQSPSLLSAAQTGRSEHPLARAGRFLLRHRRAAIALVILNEIRGLCVVGVVLWPMLQHLVAGRLPG